MKQDEELCTITRIALLISRYVFIRVKGSKLCIWDRDGDIIQAKMINFCPDLRKDGTWYISLKTNDQGTFYVQGKIPELYEFVKGSVISHMS